LSELKCIPPEPTPPAREPAPPPPPPIGSHVNPAEYLFRSTSCRLEKFEKKDDSGDHMHETHISAMPTAKPIEIVCFMEGKSNITVELSGSAVRGEKTFRHVILANYQRAPGI